MKTKKSFLWLAFLILATIWILARHNQQANYYNIKGLVFGTVYNITYQYDSDLKPEIEAELKRFDFSLSPFNDSSVISRVNRNEELVTDSFFQKCFNRSMEISRETKGAFDITIAPLANAWGFGFKKGAFPDSLMIDSLLQITDYALKLSLTTRTRCDFSCRRKSIAESSLRRGISKLISLFCMTGCLKQKRDALWQK